MQTDLALDVLGEVMGWDLDRCRTEYAWLELMASYKYDDYRDFIAGIRFFEVWRTGYNSSLSKTVRPRTPLLRRASFSLVLLRCNTLSSCYTPTL